MVGSNNECALCVNTELLDWIISVCSSDCKFRIQMGQIGPKWDKSGTFKDQFQYILARCCRLSVQSGMSDVRSGDLFLSWHQGW